MTEKDAYIAFNMTENIGSVGVAALAAQFGSVAAAWESSPAHISRSGGEVDVAAELRLAAQYGVTILTPADEAYPPRLLEQASHPLALYVKGDVSVLTRPSVALIGTRRATDYGLKLAHKFAFDLAKAGYVVLSGLALGIDGESHAGALAAEGLTVGVLGSGLDRFYPEQNRELARRIVKGGGAVVSEFPFGRGPDVQTFPQRNHTVAALSGGVVAIEAPIKSGTLITAGFAADIGRPVMAVPGRVDNRMCAGCLHLIRDGARLVSSADEIIEELNSLFPRSGSKAKNAAPAAEKKAVADVAAAAEEAPRARPKNATSTPNGALPSVTLEESIVLRNLDAEGLSMNRLLELTGFDAAKLNAICMALRLKGRLRFLPGNRVAASALR